MPRAHGSAEVAHSNYSNGLKQKKQVGMFFFQITEKTTFIDHYKGTCVTDLGIEFMQTS